MLYAPCCTPHATCAMLYAPCCTRHAPRIMLHAPSLMPTPCCHAVRPLLDVGQHLQEDALGDNFTFKFDRVRDDMDRVCHAPFTSSCAWSLSPPLTVMPLSVTPLSVTPLSVTPPSIERLNVPLMPSGFATTLPPSLHPSFSPLQSPLKTNRGPSSARSLSPSIIRSSKYTKIPPSDQLPCTLYLHVSRFHNIYNLKDYTSRVQPLPALR
jgi:hypothetical protein